ncbi:MAG: sugar ABC transporter permease [Chloroflexota bacterium]
MSSEVPVQTTPPGGSDAAAPVIAPDGSTTAVHAPILGGLNIGWGTLLTTLPIYVGLILIWLYFDSQTAGRFIGSRNLSEMAQEFSYEAVLAIGVVFVLLLGEIDLSLGYLTLLSVALVASFSALQHWSAFASIAVAIIVCTLCGLFQGFLVSWVRMPSFVVTLGGFLIFEGIAYHILGGSTINVFDPFISSIGTYYLPNVLSWVLVAVSIVIFGLAALARNNSRVKAGLRPQAAARTITAGVGLAVILALVVWMMNRYRGVPLALALLIGFTLLFWFLATKTPYGRHVYAVGGNPEASRRAGINTTFIRWSVFGISGLMAGVAGVMLVGYSSAGSTTTAGPDLLLDVISIAVIGGVSLTGGKGSALAVLLGGLVIASLDSGLNLMATDPYYVYVIKGAILLAAIGVDIVGKRASGVSWPKRKGATA